VICRISIRLSFICENVKKEETRIIMINVSCCTISIVEYINTITFKICSLNLCLNCGGIEVVESVAEDLWNTPKLSDMCTVKVTLMKGRRRLIEV